ncbi:MAG: type IV toxin-antitoxin system AbiEi family antitoxin [bacterium]
MRGNTGRKGYKAGAASAFVEGIAETGRIAFDLAELVNKTGLSVIAATNQLQRLHGRVARVSRHPSFFLIVESQHRSMGAPPVEWWLDAYFRWLGHPYYLALLSAAEIYNSAPQAILVKQVMTDTPRREISIGRIRLHFYVKRGIERTPVKQPSIAYAPIRVSTPEATALDMVRYATRIGGMGRALESLTPLLPLFCTSALKRALDAEDEAAVAQRLGYLIASAGQNGLAEVVHQWLPSGIARVSLDSSKQPLTETALSRRWRVLVPEQKGGL